MSDPRQEAKSPRHRVSACRKGRHSYGESQSVGAGITRQVCRTCGAVTIDLTAATGLESASAPPSPNRARHLRDDREQPANL